MTKKLLSLLAALCILVSCLAGCETNNKETEPTAPVTVDYASEVKLDLGSTETPKWELTPADVKAYNAGDTTHFYVNGQNFPNGTLKARYLAVDTPESTGKIEVWGKKASKFTRNALENAEAIVIESDNNQWNADSTGSRYMVWVWYKPVGSAEYRNLNIELLQNGLSWASKAENNRYGQTCLAAINQAKQQKLHVYSEETDPDFYYGEAQPITMKELRLNLELYHNTKVAFEGVITYSGAQTVYAEEYDEETGMYFGMSIYYGYNMTGKGLETLQPGNRVRFVGSVQYYEQGGTWQVSDIQYIEMRPNDPNNIQLISSGHEPAHVVCRPGVFANESREMEVLTDLETRETEMQTFKYGDLVMSTSVSLENLYVKDIYTTDNEESKMYGAMTLKCSVGGESIDVRTNVLIDEEGNTVTEDAYRGQTINVKGIVGYYNGKYQIQVFSTDAIEIVE